MPTLKNPPLFSLKKGCLIALAFGFLASAAYACTGLMLKAKDGSTVSGRTAEFGIPLELSIVYIPQGTPITGTTPNGPGIAYQAKYPTVGVSAFNEPSTLDGINNQGLGVGTFYFPTFASYTTTTPENQKQSLAPSQFATWLLTQFATVAEVRAAIESGKITIAPTIDQNWGPTPAPFHYVVYDKTGASLAIEPIDGTLKLHNNALGVFTNSPTFDWHLTNLRNYITLSPFNVPAIDVDKESFAVVGQGAGALGLPGDFTPPSRFVRAAFFSATAVQPDNGQQAVFDVFHLLNNFDIPLGSSGVKQGSQVAYDYTQLTCVRDPQNQRFYWRTYGNQEIKSVDLGKLASQSFPPKMVVLNLDDKQPVDDMTAQFKAN